MFIVAAPFFLLILDFFIRVACGFGVIFMLMRIYSAHLHNAPKNLNTVLYIFFVPELITGPFRPFNKWRKLELRGWFSRLSPIIVLNSLITILLAGIIYGKLVAISDNLAFQSVIAYLALYAQFAAMTEIINCISISFGLCRVDNFRSPLFATSVGDFWSRWHISLGDFAKTYINQPLTFLAVKHGLIKDFAYPMSLLITFIFIGLWHNSSVAYLLFGLYFGVIVFIEKIFGDRCKRFLSGKKYGHILSIIYTQIAHIIGFSFVVNYIKTIIIQP
jgi:alginate O-acetyltransferase complex protein AlgI